MADQINSLGSTAQVLFGDQYKPLMQSLRDLATTGAKITEREISMVRGLPISEQVGLIKNLTKEQKQLAKILHLEI